MIFGESGSVLLRNPLFCDISCGVRTPVPLSGSAYGLVRACTIGACICNNSRTGKLCFFFLLACLILPYAEAIFTPKEVIRLVKKIAQDEKNKPKPKAERPAEETENWEYRLMKWQQTKERAKKARLRKKEQKKARTKLLRERKKLEKWKPKKY